jgi:hypothetical protein
MSEFLKERQSQIKKRSNGRDRIDRYDLSGNDSNRTDARKIEPTVVPRELILRLIQFFEQK